MKADHVVVFFFSLFVGLGFLLEDNDNDNDNDTNDKDDERGRKAKESVFWCV